MEPEDTRRISRKIKLTMPFSSQVSDNLHRVQEIQTSRRRKKMTIMPVSVEEEHHHSCSSRTMCPSSSTSSSSSSLVLFLLVSVLLFVCVVPCQSLPFDGGSLSSSSGGSSSHRSHMDLLIDPIHQAEFGDYDPLENTRVVKSVFDMVLRTPPPPTSSSNRCPPGTQSPFEGGPCIKKSTDPVAFVDQNFLLDTLRGLAKKGELLGTTQKTRRPGGSGSNRRRISGRPGSRTTSTTTASPSTTMNSEEEEGEMSPTTAFATGDNFVNVAEEEVVAITQEPITPSPPGTTIISAGEGNEEPIVPDNTNSEDVSGDQLASSGDAIEPDTAATESSPVTVMIVPVTTIVPTNEAPPETNDADLSKPADVRDTEKESSSSSTGNGKKSSPSSSNDNSYFSSFQFPFLPSSSFMPSQTRPSSSSTSDQGQTEIYRYNRYRNDDSDGQALSNSNYDNRGSVYSLLPYTNNQNVMTNGGNRKRYLNPSLNYYNNNYSNNQRIRRRIVRNL